MASRKQQRRRQKERRHEYELVVVDETGEERPIDPAELRRKRQEKEAERAKERPKGKAAPARGNRSARPVREVQPPSWGRVWKRAGAFAAFMFLVLNFIGKNQSLASRIALPLIYSVLFVPFLYLMDRVQYRQYLRRTGQEDPTAKPTNQRRGGSGPAPRPTAGESGRAAVKGLGASLRRGRRR